MTGRSKIRAYLNHWSHSVEGNEFFSIRSQRGFYVDKPNTRDTYTYLEWTGWFGEGLEKARAVQGRSHSFSILALESNVVSRGPSHSKRCLIGCSSCRGWSRAALVVSWLLVVTPILEGKTRHQSEKSREGLNQKWNPSEMRNHCQTIGKPMANSLEAMGSSLSSALPASSRRTTWCRSCCSHESVTHRGTSREFTKGIAAIGIARDSTLFDNGK